jgi:hypothetical protein
MNLADALVRLETLPYAFSSQEDGKQWRADWSNWLNRRAQIIQTLELEVHTHQQCGNFAKAGYVQEVLTVLRKGR